MDQKTLWLLSQAGAQNGLQYREMRPPGWKVWESCESGNSYAIFFYKLIDELKTLPGPRVRRSKTWALR